MGKYIWAEPGVNLDVNSNVRRTSTLAGESRADRVIQPTGEIDDIYT